MSEQRQDEIDAQQKLREQIAKRTAERNANRPKPEPTNFGTPKAVGDIRSLVSQSLDRLGIRIGESPVEDDYRPEDELTRIDNLRRSISRRMMGSESDYAGVRLLGEDLRPTKIVQMLRLELADPKRCYLLVGGPGSGKTTAAIGFIAEIADPGQAMYVHGYKFAQWIYERKFSELDKLEACQYLLIDELGAEPDGFKGKDFIAHFDFLFDHRYSRQKTTIITTNLAMADVKMRYGPRFVSRFNQIGEVLVTNDPDFRDEKNPLPDPRNNVIN